MRPVFCLDDFRSALEVAGVRTPVTSDALSEALISAEAAAQWAISGDNLPGVAQICDIAGALQTIEKRCVEISEAILAAWMIPQCDGGEALARHLTHGLALNPLVRALLDTAGSGDREQGGRSVAQALTGIQSLAAWAHQSMRRFEDAADRERKAVGNPEMRSRARTVNIPRQSRGL